MHPPKVKRPAIGQFQGSMVPLHIHKNPAIRHVWSEGLEVQQLRYLG